MKRRKKQPTVGSRIVTRLQDFAEALEKQEELSEKFTCRRMELDLQAEPYTPEQVKATREQLGTSQAIFARFLGVSVKTVRAWEQGINEPNRIACRFMDEIRHDPEYWLGRLKQAARLKM